MVIHYLRKAGSFIEIKCKFFNYYQKVLIIQNYFRSLRSILKLQVELLTSLWISKIRNLYLPGPKKTKKQLQIMKRIMKISDEVRNIKISEFYQKTIHEFCKSYKLWFKHNNMKLSNINLVQSHQESSNLQKSLKSKANFENKIDKPIFLFIPSPDKLNTLIFGST